MARSKIACLHFRPETILDTPPLCTEDDIRDLVETFYGKVRSDALLGPVFNGMVHDWDEHLTRLSDFWSAVLLGTRRFAGMPMPTHVAMPNLSAALFERWLALFGQTTAALPNRPDGRRSDADGAAHGAQPLVRLPAELRSQPAAGRVAAGHAAPLTTAGQHSAAFPANRAQRSVHQAGSSARTLARR